MRIIAKRRTKATAAKAAVRKPLGKQRSEALTGSLTRSIEFLPLLVGLMPDVADTGVF
jgi:hypothetical protein